MVFTAPNLGILVSQQPASGTTSTLRALCILCVFVVSCFVPHSPPRRRGRGDYAEKNLFYDRPPRLVTLSWGGRVHLQRFVRVRPQRSHNRERLWSPRLRLPPAQIHQ